MKFSESLDVQSYLSFCDYYPVNIYFYNAQPEKMCFSDLKYEHWRTQQLN